MRESKFQRQFIERLEALFPGCVVIKNPTDYLQGFPDLVMYWGPRWAMFEIKISANADVQPNQPYYVEKLNEMSFASFVYPENQEEVLDALQRSFAP